MQYFENRCFKVDGKISALSEIEIINLIEIARINDIENEKDVINFIKECSNMRASSLVLEGVLNGSLGIKIRENSEFEYYG